MEIKKERKRGRKRLIDDGNIAVMEFIEERRRGESCGTLKQ